MIKHSDTTLRDSFALLKNLTEAYRIRQRMPSFKGKPLLDLSVGNPDIVPDSHWRDRLQFFIQQDDLHGYGDFRSDITQFM
ncbi:TPA: hypothetical protein ACOEAZ_004376 [Enterobacter asburiae]